MIGIGEPSKLCPCMVRVLSASVRSKRVSWSPAGSSTRSRVPSFRSVFSSKWCVGQSLRQHVEAEIGVKDAGARREKLRVGRERLDVVLLAPIRCGVLSLRPLCLAGKAGGMGSKVDEPDLLAVAFRNLDVPAEPVLERVAEVDRAVSHHRGERGATECFCDRTDAHQRVAVGLLAASLGVPP